MDPLYNNNPNPTAAPGPKPTPGNAMPNIASAPAHNAPAPAPISNQMPDLSAPVPTPVMEEVPTPTMSFEQAFQNSTAPVGDFSVGATEPVVTPAEQPIDPIAEELAKPIQAAAPVPGSIGSAVSMPATEPAPAPAPMPEAPVAPAPAPMPAPAPAPMPEAPVAPAPAPEEPLIPDLPDDIEAFLNSDPAGNPAAMGASVPTTENNNVSFNAQPVSPYSSEDSFEMTNTKQSFLSKIKSDSKLKFILIAAGAFLVLIIIVVILLVAFSGGKGNNQQSNNNDQDTPTYKGPDIAKTLSCEREFTDADLVNYSDAQSGNESVEVGFDESGAVVNYDQNIELTYSDVSTAKSAEAKIKTEREAEVEAYGLEIDPFTSSYGSQDTNLYLIRNASPADYNIDKFVFYGLDMNAELDSWQTNYEASGFTCSVK